MSASPQADKKNVEEFNENQKGKSADMETPRTTSSRIIDKHDAVKKKTFSCCFLRGPLNRDAVIFACRMCFVLTASSLFVLLPPLDGDNYYPSGVTVYVTATIVSWFPSLGSANVIHKTMHRILGTMVGAGLGLSLGLLCAGTTGDNNYTLLAWSLGACVVCITFLWSFFSIQWKINNHYGYACMLGLFTFGIALLPFYTTQEPKWKNGVVRVCDVLVGCGIGAAGALIVFPRSTKLILQDKIVFQIQKAGESSCAILHAAAQLLSNETKNNQVMAVVPTLADLLEENMDTDQDQETLAAAYQLHDTYTTAIMDYKTTRGLFPLLKWDPFMAFQERTQFQHESAVTLARAFRIQTTVVLMDSVLRNGMEAMEFDQETLQLFEETGTLVKQMLHTLPNDDSSSSRVLRLEDRAAEQLLDRLRQLRHLAVRECTHLTEEDYSGEDLFGGSVTKTEFRGVLANTMPIAVHATSKASSVLFLQLVEHLIMRSLRLYHAWHESGANKIFDDKQKRQPDNTRHCSVASSQSGMD